jgi:peptidoglycan/LPS O-acetylase OafA/YrhL
MAPRSHLPELTSARFYAAMAVLLGHFAGFLALPPALARVFTGGFGVSFFFVLSGFILCYRYWDEFAAGVPGAAYRRFFAARVARIYPSYLLALLLVTAMFLGANAFQAGTVRLPPDPALSWLSHALALQTFAPTYETQRHWNEPGWSISTEFAFYAACPFLLAAVARHCRGLRGLLALFAATIAAGIAVQAGVLYLVLAEGWSRELWLDIIASRNFFWRFPEFLTGVVAARLLYGGHLAWLQDTGARNALLFAGVLAVCLLNAAPWPADSTAILIQRQFRLDLAYMIPFAGVVLALAAGPTFASPLLKLPASVFLGDVSYALYLYHWAPWLALTYLASRGWEFPPPAVALVIGFTILFAAASYAGFEKPARKYLRRKLAQ